MSKSKTESSAEHRMNLAALKRVDPYIEKLVTSAKHVALYKFGQDDGQWEKTETEGTFFVYERQGDPQYGFIVLNRLSQKNLIEPVTKEMDFQLKSPFLLYKTQESEIYGIWFHEGEECERVSNTMMALVAKTEEKMRKKQVEEKAKNKPKDLAGLLAKAGGQTTKSKQQQPQSANGQNKLMNLLTSAASENTNLKQEQHSPPIMTTAINGSNSVAEFFAQAASNGQPGGDNRIPHHPIPVMGHPPMLVPLIPASMAMSFAAAAAGGPRPTLVPMQSIPPQMQPPPNAVPNEDNAGNPVMARLISNPGVHSVEKLEQIQRMESLSPSSHISEGPTAMPKAMPPLPAMARNADELESQLKSKINLNASNQENHVLSYASMASTKVTDTDTDSKPHLLSPMVFAKTSSSQDMKENSTIEYETINGNGLSTNDNEGLEITPLTQSQLQQAFFHLLRTDKSFVTKLHQAYVESLNTKLQ